MGVEGNVFEQQTVCVEMDMKIEMAAENRDRMSTWGLVEANVWILGGA